MTGRYWADIPRSGGAPRSRPGRRCRSHIDSRAVFGGFNTGWSGLPLWRPDHEWHTGLAVSRRCVEQRSPNHTTTQPPIHPPAHRRSPPSPPPTPLIGLALVFLGILVCPGCAANLGIPRRVPGGCFCIRGATPAQSQHCTHTAVAQRAASKTPVLAHYQQNASIVPIHCSRIVSTTEARQANR